MSNSESKGEISLERLKELAEELANMNTPNSWPRNKRTRGRLENWPWNSSWVRSTAIPPEGTLVRMMAGNKQFGIVGKRDGKVGVFWSIDGWVDNYGEGELERMFLSGVEVF